MPSVRTTSLRSRCDHLRDDLAGLSPAYFGMAMATGIVSLSAHMQAWTWLASALFWLNASLYAGLWCLVGVSACMSLMFPTIYGIALEGLGDDAKLGAAGLIMAILGGSVLPPVQAAIMDLPAFHLGGWELSSARASFVLPLLCFAVIALFGWRTLVRHRRA